MNVATHPDFTIDQFISLTGWNAPTPGHKQRMTKALNYFQRTVPKSILRQPENGAPWVLRINGIPIKLTSWMQGIAFDKDVDDAYHVIKGTPLLAFKSPEVKHGIIRGNWYTFPSTRQDTTAIHSTQQSPRKAKAKQNFTCLKSFASDAYVGWLANLPAEYRRGGAAQFFIWNSQQVLEPF